MSAQTPYLLDAAGRRLALASPRTQLGRSSNSDLFIADPRVSRRHAEICWDGETSILNDLHSANGTYLNGLRITTAQTLHDGDEITIASAIFTFRDPDATLRENEFPLLVVDEVSQTVWVNRCAVSLSPKERVLFEHLYHHANLVCSKEQIAKAVWPEYQAEVYDYQIESLVKRLREKIEPDPRHPILILTQRGQGYKLLTDHIPPNPPTVG